MSSQDSSPFVPGTTWVFDIPGDKPADKDPQSMDDFLDTFDSENATLKVSPTIDKRFVCDVFHRVPPLSRLLHLVIHAQ